MKNLFPLLLFALFALFIVKEQVPALDDKFQALIHPKSFQAIQACRKEALGKSQKPQYARLVRFGEANDTQNGIFVDHILVGEMRPGEGEYQYIANCHVDFSGKIVNVHVEPYVAASPVVNPDEILLDQD